MIEPRHFITVPHIFTFEWDRPILQAQQPAPPRPRDREEHVGTVSFWRGAARAEHALLRFCWSFLGALGRGEGQRRGREGQGELYGEMLVAIPGIGVAVLVDHGSEEMAQSHCLRVDGVLCLPKVGSLPFW